MEPVKINRKTLETDISLELALFSAEPSKINTSVPFLDHMLCHIAKHGRMNINLNAQGDTEVDDHHTVEDIGIVLGQAMDKALVDMTGVARYGHFTLPMEEVLCTVAMDIRKSPHFEFKAPRDFMGKIGSFDCELVQEFFRSLAIHARINLHIFVAYGSNKHHIAEAIFKCFGRAFSMAAFRGEDATLFTTKGVL